MFSTAFQANAFQTRPLAFQIDKAREDEDKDKGHGKAKLAPPPTGGAAQAEE